MYLKIRCNFIILTDMTTDGCNKYERLNIETCKIAALWKDFEQELDSDFEQELDPELVYRFPFMGEKSSQDYPRGCFLLTNEKNDKIKEVYYNFNDGFQYYNSNKNFAREICYNFENVLKLFA